MGKKRSKMSKLKTNTEVSTFKKKTNEEQEPIEINEKN